MTRKSSLDSFAIGAMVLLCALWGFQQVAIKMVIADIPPLWQSGLRSIGATLLVGLWIKVSKATWTKGLWVAGLIAGSLFALEFGFFYMALRYTDASRVALLLYVAPFVVVIGAHFWIKGESLTLIGWLGVGLAFIGTAVVMQTSLEVGYTRLFGDLLALTAGILWGMTTLYIRKSGLSEAAPSQTLFFQLLVGGVGLSLAALFMEGGFTIPQTQLVWYSLILQTVGVATLSYLAWFALVARYSATKLSVFSFLTPLFGALSGILLLGEEVGLHHIIALILTIAGIVIVNNYGHAANEQSVPSDEACYDKDVA